MQPSLSTRHAVNGAFAGHRSAITRFGGSDAEKVYEALLAKAASLNLLEEARQALTTQDIVQVALQNGRSLRALSKGDHRFYVLVNGWACRFVTTCDGARQITDIILPGDIIYRDVAGSDPLDQQITACGPATFALLRIYGPFDRGGPLRMLIDQARNEEAALLRARLVSIGRRDAYARLAYLFAELARRLGRVGLADQGVYRCPLTQEQIGDVLGLTAVHVNRTLQALRRDNLVSVDRPLVVIRDFCRLENVIDSIRPMLVQKRS